MGAAALGAGAGLDHVLNGDLGNEGSSQASAADAALPFFGRYQAGIATPPQGFLNFASFSLTDAANTAELQALLREWTHAAANLTTGREYTPIRHSGDPHGRTLAYTGEAAELPPSQLTLTFGFGPGIFEENGRDRFGLAHLKPSALAEIPPFPGDELDASHTGGDLCVQACANDPQVAFHAIHVMSQIVRSSYPAALNWTQAGYGRTSSATTNQQTPRNLLGFKDGTNDIQGSDTQAMQRFVWAAPGDGPSWMTDGSYMVVRRIKINFVNWDSLTLSEQEEILGRRKASGAPLNGQQEHDPVDLNALRAGKSVIPGGAHIRQASPHFNGGERILRRGYSYLEDANPAEDVSEGGLFFIAYQRDPRRQFIPIQTRLSVHDALKDFIVHTGSAIFACPPGITHPHSYIGEQLLA